MTCCARGRRARCLHSTKSKKAPDETWDFRSYLSGDVNSYLILWMLPHLLSPVLFQLLLHRAPNRMTLNSLYLIRGCSEPLRLPASTSLTPYGLPETTLHRTHGYHQDPSDFPPSLPGLAAADTLSLALQAVAFPGPDRKSPGCTLKPGPALCHLPIVSRQDKSGRNKASWPLQATLGGSPGLLRAGERGEGRPCVLLRVATVLQTGGGWGAGDRDVHTH